MSAPRRLLDDGGSALEMALLRSAKDDAPPDGALERAMAVVGIGGGMAGAGAAASAGGLLKPATGLARWIIELLVWVTIGVVGGALFSGSRGGLGDPDPAQATAITSEPGSPPASAEPGAGASAPLATNAPEGRPSGEGSPAATAERRSPAASRPQQQQPRSITRPSRPTLAEEVALLDVARRALAAGDTTRALAALERHGRDFTGGSLSSEAAVLAMDVMVARGDRADASKAAGAFLAAYPASPHASHVRALLIPAEGAAARTDATPPSGSRESSAAAPANEAAGREAPPGH